MPEVYPPIKSPPPEERTVIKSIQEAVAHPSIRTYLFAFQQILKEVGKAIDKTIRRSSNKNT